MKKNTDVFIGREKFSNPFLAASGTFGYGEEFSKFFSLSCLGGFVTKTITASPRTGNPSPRIYEVSSGIINSIGLANEGIEDFIRNKGPFLRKLKTRLIVSIYGNSLSEWEFLVERIEKMRLCSLAGFELNCSCPNLHGEILAYDQTAVARLVQRLRKKTKNILIPKLSFCPHICDIAHSCEQKGADAVTLMNTIPAMAIDVVNRKPVLGSVFGGLSGPCIKPIVQAVVYKAYETISIPIIASGGISTFRDALESFYAGASLVEVGTANFSDSAVLPSMVREFSAFLHTRKETVSDLIGRAHNL